MNPALGDTEAVTLPLAILFNSSDNAENGILNKPLPSPLNNDADKLPLISTEPVNSEPLAADCTTNPLFNDTDAVTEPVAILTASCDIAEIGMLNNPLPSPLNKDDDILPLTSIEPVNSEPCCASTLNP